MALVKINCLRLTEISLKQPKLKLKTKIKAAKIVGLHSTAYKVCHSFQLTVLANKNEELIGTDADVNATDINGKSSAAAALLMAAVEKLIVVHV
jgi:hypothetical protein